MFIQFSHALVKTVTLGKFVNLIYVFMLRRFASIFQIPVLGKLLMVKDDMFVLQDALTGREMGAKEGTFSQEDIEAFKYSYRNYSKA
jgi:hypothetical protein